MTLQEKAQQPYPFHQERFDCSKQVLCRNGLTGRCYWEIEFKENFKFGVTYRGIGRRGIGSICNLGENNKSWVLSHTSIMLAKLLHNNTEGFGSIGLQDFTEVAVFLDWPAGSLSFYALSSNVQKHICSTYSRFKEPLYPAFGFDTITYRVTPTRGGEVMLPKCRLRILGVEVLQQPAKR